ncbi:MAG TPA: hypothetical protein VNR11_09495 [Xanthobacteraceae bacterium]|nr:hypothetical protein [Xanthobacteraceae bacterium]
MPDLTQADAQREAHLLKLAERLLFKAEKHGDHYELVRTLDVSRPVRYRNLTLDEVEETLDTWKLRGPHGG